MKLTLAFRLCASTVLAILGYCAFTSALNTGTFALAPAIQRAVDVWTPPRSILVDKIADGFKPASGAVEVSLDTLQSVDYKSADITGYVTSEGIHYVAQTKDMIAHVLWRPSVLVGTQTSARILELGRDNAYVEFSVPPDAASSLWLYFGLLMIATLICWVSALLLIMPAGSIRGHAKSTTAIPA